MLKKILLGLLVVLIVIQFIRPEKNESGENANNIATAYQIPANIKGMFETACNDCHSNTTRYPWYSNIQPVAWWLDSHVTGGKYHLNFSEFTNRNIAYQNHKLEEIIEMVKEKEMPLPSYTWMGMHQSANLSDEERAAITSWASQKMDSLKAVWPADSLVMKRRRPAGA